jgi:hypothetical protein
MIFRLARLPAENDKSDCTVSAEELSACRKVTFTIRKVLRSRVGRACTRSAFVTGWVLQLTVELDPEYRDSGPAVGCVAEGRS